MHAPDLPFDLVELTPVPTAKAAESGTVREVPFRRDAYLPEELTGLRALFDADASITEMARASGRPLSGLRSKLLDLGWRRRSTQPWTELDDAYMAEHYGADATATVAAQLGRSPAAIYARAQVLRLTNGNPPAWTDGRTHSSGAPTHQMSRPQSHRSPH